MDTTHQFEDGLSFLEPHATIKKANHISAKAVPVAVLLDKETSLGLDVRYDTGEVAEISWAFIRELPPRSQPRRKTSRRFQRAVGLLLILAQGLCVSAQAQVNSGSNGSDVAFNPATNTVINIADHPDGIYQYTSVNIPAGVTVSFIPSTNNSSVIWLTQDYCLIDAFTRCA